MPTTKIRKSGNSNVIILPPEYMEERSLKTGQTVQFEVSSKTGLQKLFGMGKHLKIDAQKAKDELRKEWGNW
ncbi:MAG TPA: hypothetical protein VJJ52_00070 [Candidatus Nanoarchaeia archaeon]|nr:hypothetical protein [Candidatus Nanoarchaeia archaeon]